MILLKDPISKQINQFESMSQIGAGFATWENITDTKEADEFLLLKAKNQKINEIGQAKEEALYAPIAYLNTSFSASERACQNMLGNLVLNGETVEWQELNKKPIIMTRAQFQTLAVMVKNQRNASYFKEGELMKKIASAKTPEELKNIKW